MSDIPTLTTSETIKCHTCNTNEIVTKTVTGLGGRRIHAFDGMNEKHSGENTASEIFNCYECIGKEGVVNKSELPLEIEWEQERNRKRNEEIEAEQKAQQAKANAERERILNMSDSELDEYENAMKEEEETRKKEEYVEAMMENAKQQTKYEEWRANLRTM